MALDRRRRRCTHRNHFQFLATFRRCTPQQVHTETRRVRAFSVFFSFFSFRLRNREAHKNLRDHVTVDFDNFVSFYLIPFLAFSCSLLCYSFLLSLTISLASHTFRSSEMFPWFVQRYEKVRTNFNTRVFLGEDECRQRQRRRHGRPVVLWNFCAVWMWAAFKHVWWLTSAFLR